MKFNSIVEEAWHQCQANLPKSAPRQTRDTYQVKKPGLREIPGRNLEGVFPKLKFDDRCKNGHNTFAMTGIIYALDVMRKPVKDMGGGCCHDAIVAAFPEFEHLVKWHLTSTDCPMHYLSNVCYLAGDRDCWGYAPKQSKTFKWFIRMPDRTFFRVPNVGTGYFRDPHGMTTFCVPQCMEKEVVNTCKQLPGSHPALLPIEWADGKPRELDAARRAAVWPEATDKELSVEPNALAMKLIERLPGMMSQFKQDMEAIGFKY